MSNLMVIEVNELQSNGFHAITNTYINTDTLTIFSYQHLHFFSCLIRDSFSVFNMHENTCIDFFLSLKLKKITIPAVQFSNSKFERISQKFLMTKT